MQRLLCIILAWIMILSICVGCSNSEKYGWEKMIHVLQAVSLDGRGSGSDY